MRRRLPAVLAVAVAAEVLAGAGTAVVRSGHGPAPVAAHRISATTSDGPSDGPSTHPAGARPTARPLPARPRVTRAPSAAPSAVPGSAAPTVPVAPAASPPPLRAAQQSPAAVPRRPLGPAGEWGSPVMADAFSTPDGRIDRDLWGYGSTLPGNGTTYGEGNNSYESEVYADTGENVSVAGGLTLVATPQVHVVDGRRHTYLSAAVNTRPHDPGNDGWTARRGFTFHPSRATFTLQAAIQVDRDFAHAWPAFWFVPTGYTWPPEIDALEFLTDPGDRMAPQAHVHWVDDAGHEREAPYRGPAGPQYAGGLHTYTTTIGAAGIYFWVDGRRIGAMTDPAVLAKVLDHDYYVIVNQAVTGDPGGSAMAMQVRYLAAWEQGSGATTGGGYAAGTPVP